MPIGYHRDVCAASRTARSPFSRLRKRVGVRSGRPRLLRDQLRDVLGKLGKDCTSEVHPARICECFERAGNAEMIFDFQQSRVAASCLDPEAAGLRLI
jgi:hypothetical protein